MDGSEGESAVRAREFADKLHQLTGLECVMQDERGTTVTATGYLNNTNTRGKSAKDNRQRSGHYNTRGLYAQRRLSSM